MHPPLTSGPPLGHRLTCDVSPMTNFTRSTCRCLLAAWMLSSGGLCQGADDAGAGAADLFNLSLQELSNLDIIQMNVLGAHTHPAGQLMFGYRSMFMNMEGIRNGDSEVTAKKVFAQHPEFNVAHLKMEMEEHMFNVMYAPGERVTLMAMIPYKRMAMLHTTPERERFTQHASGLGDLQVMGMLTLLEGGRASRQRLILNAGMSFPTGSIHVRDHDHDNPEKGLVKLEYPMQLGTGTCDALPGLTYLGESGRWAWGVQTIETIRFGWNSSGYRLGNQYEASAWLAYGMTDWLAPYVRVEGRVWENISGRDSAYGKVPRSAESSPKLQSGERVIALIGLNLYVGKGFLKGNRLTIEAGLPVYEYLRGPQLGLGWTINVGWTYGF